MFRNGFLSAVAFMTACGDTAPLRIAVVEGNGAPVAARLAVEDVNAAGGIDGRLLELTVVSEAAGVTPQSAIATADSLARDDRILAVIGHGGSATSLAASQVYNMQRLPHIAPSTSSPLFTKAGPFSFRMVASDEHQAAFIARMVTSANTYARVAILYVNDDYGIALRDFLNRALRQSGTVPVYDAPFIAGPAFARSVDEITTSLKGVSPDLVIWIGLSPQLMLLRPSLRKALPATKVLGSDGVSFLGAARDLDAFQGDWLVAHTDVAADRPALRGVARRFRPLSGRSLTDAAALTYDAVGIVAEALRSGATSRVGIQQFLTDQAAMGRAYNGITGRIVLDENGDARPAYVLLEITRDGTRVIAR